MLGRHQTARSDVTRYSSTHYAARVSCVGCWVAGGAQNSKFLSQYTKRRSLANGLFKGTATTSSPVR
jgi:hypothetical protein